MTKRFTVQAVRGAHGTVWTIADAEEQHDTAIYFSREAAEKLAKKLNAHHAPR